jgi:hypothetical protein
MTAAPALGVQVDRLGVVDRLGDPGGHIRDDLVGDVELGGLPHHGRHMWST